MPLHIHADEAQRVLDRAIATARSRATLPSRWIEHARAVGDATSKTYVAALGTALLARATEPRSDPMSIKASPAKRYAYSARSLCHTVLVPASRTHGFDLGATGREPLNNQPFFRYERIDDMGRVRDSAGLARLLTALRAIRRLDSANAEAALAAFIRVRLEAAANAQRIDIRALGVGVGQLLDAAVQFADEDPEGGKRGQALAAAAFDLRFENVRMGRINDPSRHLPGDVQVMEGAQVLLAAEVRQKLVTTEDVVAFARVLARAKVASGVVIAIHPRQEALDRDEILSRCEDEGVVMSFVDSVAELLSDALMWSGSPVDEAIESLPNLLIGRLEEIEVATASLRRWASLLDEEPS